MTRNDAIDTLRGIYGQLDELLRSGVLAEEDRKVLAEEDRKHINEARGLLQRVENGLMGDNYQESKTPKLG
jgi:hypothetical protein